MAGQIISVNGYVLSMKRIFEFNIKINNICDRLVSFYIYLCDHIVAN